MRDSQPRLLRFDRANRFWINKSRVQRQLCDAGGKGRLRLSSAEKNGKTDAMVQPDSTSFAACEHLTRRPHHAPTAPSRATHSCRSCFSWLKPATHTGRFTPAARQNTETSIRKACCLHVLTLAFTGPRRTILNCQTARLRGSVCNALFCRICRMD